MAARVLWHGTTRQRAEAILRDGPSSDFLEPKSLEKAKGFSLAPTKGPYPLGDPRLIAAGKAALFPDEGGPAILEVEIPEELIDLATDQVSEVRFEPGFGLEELRRIWPTLPKRILEHV